MGAVQSVLPAVPAAHRQLCAISALRNPRQAIAPVARTTACDEAADGKMYEAEGEVRLPYPILAVPAMRRPRVLVKGPSSGLRATSHATRE